MEVDKSYNSVINLWSNLSKDISTQQLEVELEVYKRLLRFFQVGAYYYCIFNLNTRDFDIVSPSVEKVLGYSPQEFSLAFWFSKIHPDDKVVFANFEHETGKFLYSLPFEKLYNYKVQYDLRIQKKDGTYARILNQVLTIQQYDTGGIQRTLTLQTDITHLKPTGKPMLSFIGLGDEPSYIDVQIGNPLIPVKELLTKREKEILQLILDGKTNKEIAVILFLSKQTVDTHRKNMLSKNNLKNSSELIVAAIRNGWL